MKEMFQQARNLIKLINYEGKGDRGEYYYFKFGDGTEIPITIEYIFNGDGKAIGRKLNCKCKFCSIYDNQFLCLYKIALILKKAGVR